MFNQRINTGSLVPYIENSFLNHHIEQAVDIKYKIAMLDEEIESYQKLGLQNLIDKAYKRKDDLKKSLENIYKLISESGHSNTSRFLLSDIYIRTEINECSEALNKIGDDLLKEFLIDTDYCDVLEEIILKLANIEEEPKYCLSNHNLTAIADKIKPEIKHTPKNSVFFKLGLSEPNSIVKLKLFLEKNHIEFHDYTDKIISTNSDKLAKLICINSRGLLRTLYPKLLKFLNNNPSEIDHYRKVTLRKYAEIVAELNSQLSKSDSQNKPELLKEIDYFNGNIKQLKKLCAGNGITDSIVGFFNNPVVKASAVAVIGAALTATLLYR